MTLDELRQTFALIEGWEDRYAVLIDLGRQLDPLPQAAYCDANKVRGCMSQVWMTVEETDDEPPRLVFHGDSDAHIVKGLIAVLLLIFSGRSAAEIAAIDIRAELAELQLEQHISVNRRNGLFAMVERIQQLAREQAA